jgi:hypothetical protein
MEFQSEQEATQKWAEVSPSYNHFNPEHRAVYEAYSRYFNRAHPGTFSTGTEPQQIRDTPPNSEKKNLNAADEQSGEQSPEQQAFIDAVAAELQSDSSDPAWSAANFEASVERVNNAAIKKFGSVEKAQEILRAAGADKDPSLWAGHIRLFLAGLDGNDE